MDYFNSQNSKGNQTQPPQYIYNPTSNKYEQNLQQSVAQSSINNPEQQSVVTKQPTYVYNSKTGMYEQEQ
ncbi:MAG: hypothetical protein LBD11_08430 [Candidatus Peribacteria bacterium]|jgi:hypothetical protein|nr:hypothetical protein [Candidatus Peribacteria bacterium]